MQEIMLAYTKKSDIDKQLKFLFISVKILNKRCDFIIYQGMDDFDKNSAAYFNA